MSEETAINVTGECADVYYESFEKLPSDIKKKLSVHMIRQIFNHMVVPAIEKARKLDRGFND